MIKLPEARVISDEIRELLVGKKILNTIRGYTPHKFMFSGDFDSVTFSEIVTRTSNVDS